MKSMADIAGLEEQLLCPLPHLGPNSGFCRYHVHGCWDDFEKKGYKTLE